MKTMKKLTGCDLLKTSKVTKFFLIVTGLFFITSCATSTHIVSSWTNEDYQKKSYEKVMVLGVSDNNSARGAVESALVKRLTENNIPAVSSLNLFPDALKNKLLSKEEIVSKLKSKNIDALLVVSLLDIKEEQNYVPGHTYTEPVHSYHNHPAVYYNSRYPYYNTSYYGYYSTAYRTVHEPGYYVNTKKIYLETNFYSVEMEGLVWTAQSESIDPNNVGELSIQYAEIVVSAMLQDELFDLSEK